MALLAAGPAVAPARAQDEPPPEERAPYLLDLPNDPPRFGEADSVWVSGGFSVADNSRDAVAANAWTAISWFAAEDVEMGIELALWGHNQPGDNALSLSVSNTVRWHFVNTGEWTLFGDIGLGLLASTSTVPDHGTGLNFLPRVGAGFTRRLTDTSRLQVGIRWHHISNARIGGDQRNPSRDSALVYAGVVFAF